MTHQMETPAFILESPSKPGHPDHETTLLIRALKERKTPWSFLPLKRLIRYDYPAPPTTPAAGGLRFTTTALRKAGLEPYADLSYPEELTEFLGRKIQQTTLRQALEAKTGTFIKPAKRSKLFTGFVRENARPYQLLKIRRDEPVFICDRIDIKTEYRTYVIDGIPAYTAFCCGDRNEKQNDQIIKDICRKIPDKPWKAGCVIDTAILTSGKSVLLEVNDGFSVGAYGSTPCNIYLDMIEKRWKAQPGKKNAATPKSTCHA